MSRLERTYSKDSYEAKYTIHEDHHNFRLDQFLKLHFESFSREQVKSKIAKGDIEIPQKKQRLKASTKVKSGETVVIKTYACDEAQEYWRGSLIEREKSLEVIYDHEDYSVINKPAFMSTHPTGKHLFYCATVYLENQFKHKFYSVHRLDRETSGVMVLSKSSQSSQMITPLFENRQVKKTYFLIGVKKKSNYNFPFTAKERLGLKENFIPNMFMHCFDESSKEGKVASTHFKLIWQNKDYLIALAFPETGRQHQIRSHAAHHGFPLLGDKIYNGDPYIFTRFKDGFSTEEDLSKMQLPRHALHAIKLELPSPIQKNFTSNIPHDLMAWIEENLEVNGQELQAKIQSFL